MKELTDQQKFSLEQNAKAAKYIQSAYPQERLECVEDDQYDLPGSSSSEPDPHVVRKMRRLKNYMRGNEPE